MPDFSWKRVGAYYIATQQIEGSPIPAKSTTASNTMKICLIGRCLQVSLSGNIEVDDQVHLIQIPITFKTHGERHSWIFSRISSLTDRRP